VLFGEEVEGLPLRKEVQALAWLARAAMAYRSARETRRRSFR
jgi:hypothetical protein